MPVARVLEQSVEDSICDQLRTALRLTREGKVAGLAMVMITPAGETETCFVGPCESLLVATAFLTADLADDVRSQPCAACDEPTPAGQA